MGISGRVEISRDGLTQGAMNNQVAFPRDCFITSCISLIVALVLSFGWNCDTSNCTPSRSTVLKTISTGRDDVRVNASAHSVTNPCRFPISNGSWSSSASSAVINLTGNLSRCSQILGKSPLNRPMPTHNLKHNELRSQVASRTSPIPQNSTPLPSVSTCLQWLMTKGYIRHALLI